MIHGAFPEDPHLFVELRDMLLDACAYPVIHAASMQAVALLLEHVLEILATRQQEAQGLHLRGQRLPRRVDAVPGHSEPADGHPAHRSCCAR